MKGKRFVIECLRLADGQPFKRPRYMAELGWHNETSSLFQARLFQRYDLAIGYLRIMSQAAREATRVVRVTVSVEPEAP